MGNLLKETPYSEITASLEVLARLKVGREHLARLRVNNGNNDIARRVAEIMLGDSLARAIMGKNIWLPEDWVSFYGWRPGKKQLNQVAEFPWGEDILNSTCPLCGNVVKDCHFAFVGLDRVKGRPLTILKLQELHPATEQPNLFPCALSACDPEQKFAKETTMSFGWYLLHQTIVLRSENKSFNDQKAMLTADYEVPSAVTEFTKDLLVFRKTGHFANYLSYANCKCALSDDHPVGVGRFVANILGTSHLWSSGYLICPVGVAASRKLPLTY